MNIFSSGGGVQSTAALVLSAQGKIDYPIHVFANVGAKTENPETIAYVEEVLKPYATKHGIEWVEVCKRDRKGNPVDLYEHLLRPLRSVDFPMRMSGTGSPGNRKCTQDWKVEVVGKWIKQNHSGCVLGKGISTDEIHRARTDSGFDFYTVAYPLIELELNRSDCIKIVADAGLPPAPKSSCWFCPYKKMSQWQDLKRKQPMEFSKAVELEKLMIQRRSEMNKDAVYLTQRGATTGATLEEVVSDQLDLFEDWGLDNCESGFCMV